MELAWRARRRKALVAWPDAVDERLDLLVAAGLAAGENVNRSQLLAALVVNADLSPEFVTDILRAYRTMSTDDLESANRATANQWPKARRTGPRRGTGRTPEARAGQQRSAEVPPPPTSRPEKPARPPPRLTARHASRTLPHRPRTGYRRTAPAHPARDVRAVTSRTCTSREARGQPRSIQLYRW